MESQMQIITHWGKKVCFIVYPFYEVVNFASVYVILQITFIQLSG